MKRSRSVDAASRSPHAKPSWKRLIITSVATILAAIAIGAVTFAQVIQQKSPHIALAIFPGNAQANNVLARRLLQAGPQAPTDTMLLLARRSLSSQGLNSEALRNAGFAKSLSGQTEEAHALFLLSQKANKRDPLTNLALFQDAIKKGGGTQAIALLDRVLRVEPAAQQSIFPILGKAIADPSVMREIAPAFAKAPDWAVDFAGFAVNDGSSAPSFADLIERYPRAAAALSEERRRTLVRRLAEAKEYSRARKMRLLFGGHAPSGPDDLSFAVRGDWPPFDWELGSSGELSVFDGSDKKGIEFTATGAGLHRVAWRLLQLAPGAYRLSAKAGAIEGPLGDMGLRVVLSCAGDDGRQLATLAWRAESQNELGENFAVPHSCSVQRLEVQTRGERRAYSGLLSDIRIESEE